jgi:hypothetical protein
LEISADYTDYADFLEIIAELKALTNFGEIKWAQVLNYLKASGHETLCFIWSHDGARGKLKQICVIYVICGYFSILFAYAA